MEMKFGLQMRQTQRLVMTPKLQQALKLLQVPTLELQQILDRHTDPWGIKVSAVEVKNVDLPQEMQRAMARQAEAEREKRAKIIHAEGELIASEKLSQAAAVLDREPLTITLRYLQTLTEISAEKNSTIIFPLPIDLLRIIRESAIGSKT